jgi:hypothetical protein
MFQVLQVLVLPPQLMELQQLMRKVAVVLHVTLVLVQVTQLKVQVVAVHVVLLLLQVKTVL